MRKKILAANWKMNLTHSEAESYLETFLSEIGQVNDVEIVIIPPFTAIPALVSASEKVPAVRIGAQNMHFEASGAYARVVRRQDLTWAQLKKYHPLRYQQIVD